MDIRSSPMLRGKGRAEESRKWATPWQGKLGVPEVRLSTSQGERQVERGISKAKSLGQPQSARSIVAFILPKGKASEC